MSKGEKPKNAIPGPLRASAERQREKIEKFGGGSGDGDHTPLGTYLGLHRSAPTLPGGSCLSRCKGEYDEKDSCSYRWQAVERLWNHDQKIYKPLVTAGMTREQVPELFKNGSDPWPNNAHHLIPIDTIMRAIGKTTKNKPELAVTIIKDLMTANYNINYYENMMILPQRAKESFALGLPTHPDYAAIGNVKAARHFVYHTSYSAKVRKRVALVFSAYDDITKAKECPPVPDRKDVPQLLLGISNLIHKSIIELSATFIKTHEGAQGDDLVTRMSINDKSYLGQLFPELASKKT